ncbi:MAG TPA: hypothetical protein VNL17_08600 [Verrucomicrobiae bacterium]|nr:hypothetical protein [Verrucomicrobiae bacterium]
MKKHLCAILLTATVLATYVYAQGGYPLGSDVASTITTNKLNIVGASSTLVATDNADRVFCKIVQRGTNAIDVGYSLTVTNGQQDYLVGTVGSTWDTKRPALYKGAISAILDSSTATLTSAVTVIEGTRQSF